MLCLQNAITIGVYCFDLQKQFFKFGVWCLQNTMTIGVCFNCKKHFFQIRSLVLGVCKTQRLSVFIFQIRCLVFAKHKIIIMTQKI